MLDEMFQIVLDPFYPPSRDYEKARLATSKKFELIYSEGKISNKNYV